MVFGFGSRDLSTTCGNCALVCDPDRAERDRRIASLQQGGVVVQHEDGSVEAVSAKDAKDYLAAMPVERRQDFEFVEDGD
jgi:hypothetical protein